MFSVRRELNPYMLCFRLLREGRHRSARRYSNLLLVGVHVFQFNELQFEHRLSPGGVAKFILAFGILGI
jgi:hypothetical protein